jgi:hypothetical protein
MRAPCAVVARVPQRLTDDGLFSIDVAVELQGRGESPVAPPTGPAEAGGRIDGSPVADAREVDVAAASGEGAVAADARGEADGSAALAPEGGTVAPLVRVAVEAQGPSHYTANTNAILANTTYRRRALRAAGWRVVWVPYWEWPGGPEDRGRAQDAVGGGGVEAARDAMLVRLLQEAGVGALLRARAGCDA